MHKFIVLESAQVEKEWTDKLSAHQPLSRTMTTLFAHTLRHNTECLSPHYLDGNHIGTNIHNCVRLVFPDKNVLDMSKWYVSFFEDGEVSDSNYIITLRNRQPGSQIIGQFSIDYPWLKMPRIERFGIFSAMAPYLLGACALGESMLRDTMNRDLNAEYFESVGENLSDAGSLGLHGLENLVFEKSTYTEIAKLAPDESFFKDKYYFKYI